MQVLPLHMWPIPSLHLPIEMKIQTIIKTNIKEANQRDKTIASSSIRILLLVKYAVKKVIMPQIAKIATQNLMQTL